VEDLRIKLFTHTDMDGVSNAIIANLAFGKENVDIEYCNYNDVNEKVKNFYIGADKNHYDRVFITDISVNEEVANIIDYYEDGGRCYAITTLLDHHPTALFLNDYTWAYVGTEEVLQWEDAGLQIHKVCGGYLFLTYLMYNAFDFKEIKKLGELQNLCVFIEQVRKYDTWEWKTFYQDEIPKQLNDLLYIYGRERFIDRVTDKILNGKFEFDKTDLLLLELEQDKITNYIEKKNKELIKKAFKPNIDSPIYSVGFVFAENYISELGNKLAEANTDLDFVVIITNGKTISYRGIKDTIDLGKDVASIFGGGGHPKSAGSQISEELKLQMIHNAFGFE
jgi:oligoribonuclease NrnB/cAMP/cGMP phosphodiesterase (DHH superfamily)